MAALPRAAPAAEVFTDEAAAAGVDFVHFNGMSGELYYAEMVGPGVALFDYDADGDADLFVPQGRMLGSGKGAGEATFPPPPAERATGRLYRNDSAPRAGGPSVLRFTDVTAASGLVADGYGMGVATGDFDNDGFVDLYLANFGTNQLWRNRGDGTFEEVAARAGVADPSWSVSASFADYDADGYLDLFVVDYVDFTIHNHKPCFTSASARDYCGPLSYPPLPDHLFRNRGDGTFEDVGAAAGIAARPGTGLGVVAADLDGDGRLDYYVANDQMENFLWLQREPGRFEESAVLSGVAVNAMGAAEASMGVDLGDSDGDGDDDIFLTHLTSETNTLYVNQGDGLFSDRTSVAGLAAPSVPFTSFGTAWIDYDNDGWQDLLVVNGAVRLIEEQRRRGDLHPLAQRDQLFRNLGGRFEDASSGLGSRQEVGRGLAVGDLDADGDLDAVVTNNAGPLRLLVNRVGQDRAWIGFRVVDPKVGGRDALGARLEVRTAGGRSLSRRVRTDGSYASASDPRVVVGLGDETALREIAVTWPDGALETFAPLPLRRYHTLRRGDGRAVAGAGDESAAGEARPTAGEARPDSAGVAPSG